VVLQIAMNKYIAILLLIISSGSHAGFEDKRPTQLYIKKTISDEETLYKFNFPDESVFVEIYSVWSSARGIDCSATLFGNEGNEDRPFGGSYECKTPEGYKAQISFDCSKNKMALH
jgi:hypothetical protein